MIVSCTNLNSNQINSSVLIYTFGEFDGELFRMNLSCSSKGSGCLWFKVVGETDLTLSKFTSNNIVQNEA